MEQFKKPKLHLENCIRQNKARKYGPVFQCLNEEICAHKVDIGFKKFCADKEENGGKSNGSK